MLAKSQGSALADLLRGTLTLLKNNDLLGFMYLMDTKRVKNMLRKFAADFYFFLQLQILVEKMVSVEVLWLTPNAFHGQKMSNS